MTGWCGSTYRRRRLTRVVGMVVAVYVGVVRRGWGGDGVCHQSATAAAVAVVSGDCGGGVTALTVVVIVVV